MSKILVVAPHMDDEVLGCGGTIAWHVDRGDEVHVCILCNRAYEHSYDDEAIETERECAERARQILGYPHLLFLDLPDERLYAHLQDALSRVEELIQEIEPEVVYIPHAEDLHQDHRTVAHVSNIALRAVEAPFARRILAYEVPSCTGQTFPGAAGAFAPNVFVDIEEQLSRKLAAMKEYERESRAFPHPRSPEMLEATARVRGGQCGRVAAEAFVLLRETI